MCNCEGVGAKISVVVKELRDADVGILPPNSTFCTCLTSIMYQLFLEHVFISVLMPAAAEDVDNGSIKENYIRPGSVRFLLQRGRTISLTRVGHFQNLFHCSTT